jgi:hypothetical protein
MQILCVGGACDGERVTVADPREDFVLNKMHGDRFGKDFSVTRHLYRPVPFVVNGGKELICIACPIDAVPEGGCPGSFIMHKLIAMYPRAR